MTRRIMVFKEMTNRRFFIMTAIIILIIIAIALIPNVFLNKTTQQEDEVIVIPENPESEPLVNREPKLMRVKEGVTQRINVRAEPSLLGKIIGKVDIDDLYFWVPIVKSTGIIQGEYMEIGYGRFEDIGKCRLKNGCDTHKYGWVAKKYFREVDLASEGLARLIRREDDYRGLVIHYKPDIKGKERGVMNTYLHWNECVVKLTRRQHNEWTEIQCPKNEKILVAGWVFGEYLGIFMNSVYQAFPQPITLISTGQNIVARKESSILSEDIGHFWRKGLRVKFVGRKDPWLKTDKGKWVYKGYFKPI